MKLSALLIGLALTLSLAGCSSFSEMNNPFEQPSIEETYISQFKDIPIPAPLSTVQSETLVTVSPDGNKYGLESFSGRVEGVSLANVMMQNMAKQGWQLRGSSIGVRSIQLYAKDNMFAALFFRDGTFNATMDIWVINAVNLDVVSLVPEVHNQVNGSKNSSPSNVKPIDTSMSSSSAGSVTRLEE